MRQNHPAGGYTLFSALKAFGESLAVCDKQSMNSITAIAQLDSLACRQPTRGLLLLPLLLAVFLACS